MTNDDLIRTLVADLRPVQRLATVGERTRLWLGFAVLGVSCGVYVLGLRADLPAKLHEPSYLAEAAALLAAFVFAGWSTFRLSVPGRGEQPSVRILPLLALLTWLLLVMLRGPFPSNSLTPAFVGIACIWRVLVLSLAPALAMFWMLRRGATFARGWAGQFAALAAGSIGMVGTQALCARDEAQHVLLWHGVPLVLAALAGAVLGKGLIGRG